VSQRAVFAVLAGMGFRRLTIQRHPRAIKR
jgi:hypothetical protein